MEPAQKLQKKKKKRRGQAAFCTYMISFAPIYNPLHLIRPLIAADDVWPFNISYVCWLCPCQCGTRKRPPFHDAPASHKVNKTLCMCGSPQAHRGECRVVWHFGSGSPSGRGGIKEVGGGQEGGKCHWWRCCEVAAAALFLQSDSAAAAAAGVLWETEVQGRVRSGSAISEVL